jgi:hypothetical protein
MGGSGVSEVQAAFCTTPATCSKVRACPLFYNPLFPPR